MAKQTPHPTPLPKPRPDPVPGRPWLARLWAAIPMRTRIIVGTVIVVVGLLGLNGMLT